MIDSLRQRGLPVVLLAAAALALVLFFVRPALLVEGFLGVASGILSTWSTDRPRPVGRPAPPGRVLPDPLAALVAGR